LRQFLVATLFHLIDSSQGQRDRCISNQLSATSLNLGNFMTFPWIFTGKTTFQFWLFCSQGQKRVGCMQTCVLHLLLEAFGYKKCISGSFSWIYVPKEFVLYIIQFLRRVQRKAPKYHSWRATNLSPLVKVQQRLHFYALRSRKFNTKQTHVEREKFPKKQTSNFCQGFVKMKNSLSSFKLENTFSL